VSGAFCVLNQLTTANTSLKKSRADPWHQGFAIARIAAMKCGRCSAEKPFRQTIGALILATICVLALAIMALVPL
jgi:hypothetical protein